LNASSAKLARRRPLPALNHPGICIIHAIGTQHDGSQFIAMELLEGQTLDRVLHPLGALPIPRTIDIGIQLADALADAAHKKGIIHRDIKPSNHFVTERERRQNSRFWSYAKLLSRRSRQFRRLRRTLADTETMLLTSPGTAVGQSLTCFLNKLAARELDPRSDIFSLGGASSTN